MTRRVRRVSGASRCRAVASDAPHSQRWLCGLLLLVVVLLALDGVATAAISRLQMEYAPATDDEAGAARDFVAEQGIARTVSSLINDEFRLAYPLTVKLGTGERPAFDAAADEIHMPYGFVYAIADRFHQQSRSGGTADVYLVTRDAYLHALMHEISHALFVMYDLRTSGSLEQAADALAILLLLRYYDDGGDIVLNAARLFAAEGTAAGRGVDFWSEHRFDQQSYNQALCLVYGSAPQRYAGLLDDSEFLQRRGSECVREYKRQVNVWFRVLGDHLKRPPP